ncbi:hypothetical protein VTK26DRAFT_101 [Humicola hyalothermophila]
MPKRFRVLENSPEVMNALARKLGLSDKLAFYDVYSLDDPKALAHIPRPAYALLVTIPLTAAWKVRCEAEDEALGDPDVRNRDGAACAREKAVIWFKQTIDNACGSIALLHCTINGAASKFILPGTTLDQLRNDALPLTKDERAQVLYDNSAFEEAHQSVAVVGDTRKPAVGSVGGLGQHFVAYVRVVGHLWELDGSRIGPVDRGEIGEDEDLLSPKALELGLKRIIKLECSSGHFSCIALAPTTA